jgi:HTH-type transcriptional regulator / antitoxin HigA
MDAAAYAEQLAKARPRLIRSSEEAAEVQTLIDHLLDNKEVTAEDREFLAFLGRLILAWEEGKYEPIRVPPLETVRFLLEENGLRQQDLVGPVFPTKGVASEVLGGKRRLTYDFVDKLADFFHVSPALFYPAR